MRWRPRWASPKRTFASTRSRDSSPPGRNSENGYREYGPREVDQLRQVKLLRKLGVPLEEIRKMQSGTHTVGDGMRRHLVTLEQG